MCMILSESGITAIVGSCRVWSMKIPHPHPLMTLVQLARGPIPLPLPMFKTLGYVLGHLNGVVSLVWEAKEVLGCGSCEVLGCGSFTSIVLALAWVIFPIF